MKDWLTIEEIAAESRKFLMKTIRPPSADIHPAEMERAVWQLVQQRYEVQQLEWNIERRKNQEAAKMSKRKRP